MISPLFQRRRIEAKVRLRAGPSKGFEVLLLAQDLVRLGAGAERYGVTVGVLARQDVLVPRQRIEELLVEEI